MNNIVWKEYREDGVYMMAIQIGGTIYRVNKYLVVKSFKRLLVDKFNSHWPEFYGSNDGICYDDWMLMKDIDCSLMVIWSDVTYKDFKIGVAGTMVLNITLERNINVREMLKAIRKNFELSIDLALTDISCRRYGDNDLAYRNKKNLWLGRKRNDKDPKECEIINQKIIIEVNGVENTYDGKLCSLWNKSATCKYL
jgi:hypothetical protein